MLLGFSDIIRVCLCLYIYIYIFPTIDNPLKVDLPTPDFWDTLWKLYRLNGVINLSLISQFSLKHASNKVSPQGEIGASYTFCHINPSSVVGSSSNYTPDRSFWLTFRSIIMKL